MNSPTRQQIVNDLAEMLRTFEGREYSGQIDEKTLLFGELGLASIDAVVLGEQLEDRYQQSFAFHELLARLATDGREDFALGELADFLHAQLSAGHQA